MKNNWMLTKEEMNWLSSIRRHYSKLEFKDKNGISQGRPSYATVILKLLDIITRYDLELYNASEERNNATVRYYFGK